MRSVGLFTYSVKPRGSVVHAACLAEALAALGCEVTLYALSKSGDGFFRPLACPLELFPAGPAPAEPERLIEQRILELQAGFASVAGRHDVYHAEDCLTASALLTANLPGLRPIVRTVHHVEHFENAYLAACQRRSIELADALVSVSDFTAREVKAGFGREAPVIHNGVDAERFAPRSAADVSPSARVPASLAQLGLRESDLVVLSVGGVEERKNTLRALEAVSRAAVQIPRLYWLVVGGASIWDHSELERRFDARLAELSRDERPRIARLGPVDEATLTWLYRRANLLLAPALHEGWGLSVLEAMAARTAVICSRREPFTEFLDDDSAVLVDPESTQAILSALIALGTSPAQRTRLALAAELRARSFTWERAARAHLELYASLLDPSAPARVPALPAA
jgi:glycosyltransferase-like protein